MKHLIAALGLCGLCLCAEGLNVQSARAVFKLANDFARQDHGALWGKNLEGPILLVDPETKRMVANQADREGRLTEEDGLFVGPLPKELICANTATDFGGLRWTMVLWSALGTDSEENARLLMHESWHRIQGELGLRAQEKPCGHLDEEAGRLWLRLEQRALGRALLSVGEPRRKALGDALAFRAERHRLFPEAIQAEAYAEKNEGLATYTELRLTEPLHASEKRVAQRLEQADKNPHFARSYAYGLGAAYGLLLDEAAPGWRTRIAQADSIQALLPESFAKAASGDLEHRGAPYGLLEIRREEGQAAAERVERVGRIRERFQKGHVLCLPNVALNIGFDPREQEHVEGLGMFYPRLKGVAAWGILQAKQGAVIADDWSSVTLSAPTERTTRCLIGPGYAVELKEGWVPVPGQRPGDCTIAKQEQAPKP